MHAALILHALGPGGTERQVTYMTAGLVARGHRVTVVEIRYGEHFREAVQQAGGEVVSAAVGNRADVAPILRIVRALRADVAYGLNPEANILALVARAPTVFGVRGTNLGDMPKDLSARLAMRLQHLLARRARLIVANSDAAARELRERGYPASRVHVVRNGIDPGDFAADPGDRARWRARLGVADGEQLVATVARMDRQKDAGTFLRAAARAARPGRRFAWFGDGPLRPQVESLARSLGVDLLVPGAQHDVRGAYAAMDVFTLTSAWGEAFSNAFAEALAAGRACVVTDTGDHASARAVAMVVPPADPAALAKGWDRAAPGDGPGWLRANLGVDQMVSNTETLLLDALRGR